ncbi:hypothetical protein BD626DRAFT_420507 [Schizophyllum amplum]|uniref:Uncharacterized protein n=1 Tax=Schizophyllum amplum TaxID=97359 RepID=A0A550BRF1_9AGAR|nr:hypothetical protein BD626DRAFT_420507 [Auriculariopsis ampla]
MSALHGKTTPALRIHAPPLNPARRSTSKTTPGASDKRKRRATEQRVELDNMLETIDAWCVRMADKFEKNTQYFHELLWQNGLHLVSRRETNSFNAYNGLKSLELREEGRTMNAIDMATDNALKSEYNSLSNEQRATLVAEWDKHKSIRVHNARVSGMSRKQDFHQTTRTITTLLEGLEDRVGVEAMVVIVRNNSNYYAQPFTFWTNPELEKYMAIASPKWDTARVVTKMEAFAIAGCDTARAWP